MLNAVVNGKLCQVTNFSDTAIHPGCIFLRQPACRKDRLLPTTAPGNRRDGSLGAYASEHGRYI